MKAERRLSIQLIQLGVAMLLGDARHQRNQPDHASLANIRGDMGWLAVFLVAFILLAAVLLKVTPKREN